MRHLVALGALALGFASPVTAADRLSGTWTTGGSAPQTFVFKASGEPPSSLLTLGPAGPPSPIEGRWVFGTILPQQNLILKVQGQKVWEFNGTS